MILIRVSDGERQAAHSPRLVGSRQGDPESYEPRLVRMCSLANRILPAGREAETCGLRNGTPKVLFHSPHTYISQQPYIHSSDTTTTTYPKP